MLGIGGSVKTLSVLQQETQEKKQEGQIMSISPVFMLSAFVDFRNYMVSTGLGGKCLASPKELNLRPGII